MQYIFYIGGGILLLAGLAGFVNDPLIGIFETDAAHNLLHLATGAALLYFGVKETSVRKGARALGVIYAALALIGLITPGSILGIAESNGADTVLHATLAVILLYVGFAEKEAPVS